jgi:hypothetical protein
MSTEFQVTLVEFGDEIGFGAWQTGHARQHLRYLSVLAARSPPVILPDVPLFRIGATRNEVKEWLRTHYFDVHVHLREQTGLTGSDFSNVDFSNPKFFYDFLDLHNTEHTLIDQALGL